MKKSLAVGILVVLLMGFMLTACSTEKSELLENQESTAASQDSAPTTEVAADATEEDAVAAWPGDLMGNLPVPECQVVSVSEYDASSMSGELIVVNYMGMSKAFAANYAVMLTALGFVDGISISNEDKILFSGTAQDLSAVNFDFDVKTQSGNISYKPAQKQ